MSSNNKRKRTTSSGKVKEAQAVRVAPVQAVTRATTPEEFNPDYSYVVKDLKRIGTLAGSFIVILIALSFFLR